LNEEIKKLRNQSIEEGGVRGIEIAVIFFLTTVTIEDVEGGDEGYTNIFLFSFQKDKEFKKKTQSGMALGVFFFQFLLLLLSTS
jgi:hypothetical protein